MNKPTSFLLRCLGFKRAKPITRLGRCLRRTERILAAIFLIYICLLAFPQVLFGYSVTAQGVTVYSRDPLHPQTTNCIARAMTLVAQSELAITGREEKVFICNSPRLFRVFRPFNHRVFAISFPFTDYIFVANADPLEDRSRSTAGAFNSRSFSGVMAHEITHGLIRQRTGLFRAMQLPSWVSEGYCDYVAGESSFPEIEGIRLLAEGQSHPSMSFRYFSYRQIFRHLIEDQQLSFNQIVARSNEFSANEASMRQALRAAQIR